MRIQWINETFCPCCNGFCVSAKVYGIIRRLDIAKDTKKDGIFGEFQRDGGDFVWWHSCLPNCKENRRPIEAEINDAYSELLDDINSVEQNKTAVPMVTYDDHANGFHAVSDGDDWVSEYIELYEYNASRFENVTPPAADVTDTSWRAEVVEDAIAEDELDAQLEAAAEAELEALARYESEMLAETAAETAAERAEEAAVERCVNVAYDRALKRERRRWAIMCGARPYVPAYDLAPDVAVFEGEIFRVLEPYIAFGQIPI